MNTDSRTMLVIQSLDRDTLELALLVAVTSLRRLGTGEMPPPPPNLSRVGITANLVLMARQLQDAAAMCNDDVSDTGQAQQALANIFKKEG